MSEHPRTDPQIAASTGDRSSLFALVRRNLRVGVSRQEAADVRDAIDSIEWLLGECRANIGELADDLKGFYEPEKGWPPHIDKAREMVAELDDALGRVDA